MKPNTKPTTNQLAQMERELHRLISTFGAQQACNELSVSAGTIRTWLHRGRISAVSAHQICKINAVRDLGFTRELLRPDVKIWTMGA